MVPRAQGRFFYRDRLRPQGKTFYDGMLAQFSREDYSGRVTLPVSQPGSLGADCQEAFQALRDDHPELFWLGTRYELIQFPGQAAVRCDVLYKARDIPRIRRQLYRRMEQLLHGTAGMPPLQAECLVYRRIAMQLRYVNNQDYRDHNIVGPVLQGTGVCEGYTAMLLLCLRQLGIPCIKVYGRSRQDSRHCWSMVWLEGECVHCDVTWDMPRDGILFFDYFNLSDRQISRDHFDFRDRGLPQCTAEHLNYYRLSGCCFSTRRGFASHVRAGMGALSREPIYAQLPFAHTGADIHAAVAEALNGCVQRPACHLRVNPALGTAVLFP